MNKFDLVIKGNVVLDEKVIKGQVGITNGKIEEIVESENNRNLNGSKEVDFGDSLICPGAIDVHVHCFSNPDEGFLDTSISAAAGGVTTFLDMPYDLPNPVNNVTNFKQKVDLLQKEAVVDIGLWGTISKRNGTDQIIPLAKAGAMSFKMSTFETDKYRFPKIPESEIMKAMSILNELDLLVAFHSENDEIIKALINEYTEENKVYPRAHMETRPPVSETSSVLQLMEFAYWTNAKLHIAHVSHPRTFDLIKRFRAEGVNVTAETCYPYLLMDINDLDKIGPKAKMNPPLRYPKDVSGMWDHLVDGNIDLISSDHVAWKKENKVSGNENIFKASSGLAGLEIIVPLMFNSIVVEKGLSPVQFAKLMSQHPAEVFGIKNKGQIKVGYDADFVVINPNEKWQIDEEKMFSNSKMTPFDGQELNGKIVQTIVRGNTVFDGKEIQVQPGYGKFVKGAAAE
ncbi:dihydroorotase family protein [Virgibacillus byunsanensis]|uniref:Dihydroorotase family protein n=1 Tax=Virgibacillus byunsanensis TaxID=570945 RepID=A0ABW3LPT0_9BACI